MLWASHISDIGHSASILWLANFNNSWNNISETASAMPVGETVKETRVNLSTALPLDGGG